MPFQTLIDRRRRFLKTLLSGTGIAAAAAVPALGAEQRSSSPTQDHLPWYVRKQTYQSLKQSTYDRSGGNRDARPIEGGQTLTVFESDRPGIITHVWFTIAAKSAHHLKEMVVRAYWDGNSKPSVEAPIGDLFGLTLGQYTLYDSAFLGCSPGKSLNCYFGMPYKKSAKITIANEGSERVDALYANIDYQNWPELPDDTLYFHAQYRQAAPCQKAPSDAQDKNLDGKYNYVFCETRGSGHLMGVSLGIQQNADHWPGEGDEMIFIDDNSKPAITGTGTEDYFLGSWDFGGRDGAVPFGYQFYGAPLIILPERTGGRYCMYRWHADNPVTFEKSLKYTIEHGHANDRADNYYSVAYWYQREIATNFPALPPADQRIPKIHDNP